MLTPTLAEAEAVLPAKSTPVAVMVFDDEDKRTAQEKLPAEITAGTLLQVTPAKPESESETVPATFTYGVLTEAPLDGLEILIAGGVVSRFTVPLAVAELFAESVTVPDTVWFAPCAVMCTGEGQLTMGAPPGIQLKTPLTGALFQPYAFAVGERVSCIPGFGLNGNLATKALYEPLSEVWYAFDGYVEKSVEQVLPSKYGFPIQSKATSAPRSPFAQLPPKYVE